MTVLRWIASRCAVVTRLKPHSHQATSVCLSAAKSFSRDNRSSCDRVKRVRAAVLTESSSWPTRTCEISRISTPALSPASRSASFAFGAGSRQSGYPRTAFADADVYDDAVAFTQQRGGPTGARPQVLGVVG
jgi:hypothetical protein